MACGIQTVDSGLSACVLTNRQTPDQWGFVNVPSCRRSLEGLKGKGPLDGRKGSPDGLLGGWETFWKTFADCTMW